MKIKATSNKVDVLFGDDLVRGGPSRADYTSSNTWCFCTNPTLYHFIAFGAPPSIPISGNLHFQKHWNPLQFFRNWKPMSSFFLRAILNRYPRTGAGGFGCLLRDMAPERLVQHVLPPNACLSMSQKWSVQ